MVDGLDAGLHCIEGVVGADLACSQRGDDLAGALPDQILDHDAAALTMLPL